LKKRLSITQPGGLERGGGVEFECQLGCGFGTGWLGQVEHRFSDTVIPKYSAMDEKIGKKDQQDDLGSEVEREALWRGKRAW